MAKSSVVLALSAALVFVTGVSACLQSSAPPAWRPLNAAQQAHRGGLCRTCAAAPGFVCAACTCAGVPCNLTGNINNPCVNAAGQTSGCTINNVVFFECVTVVNPLSSCVAVANCGTFQNPACTFMGGACPCACTNVGPCMNCT